MTEHIIYKYNVPVDELTTVLAMPEGATILHVSSVNDQVCMWVRVMPDVPMIDRGIGIVPTGVALPPGVAQGAFIGSAVILNGRVAYHVFDLGQVH